MKETTIGVSLGLTLNIVTGIVARPLADASTGTSLVTLGTANELLGVLLVASPEIGPRLRWLASSLRVKTKAALDAVPDSVRRFLRLPPRLHHVSSSREMPYEVLEGATVRTYPSEDAPPEELLTFLLTRTKEIEERIDTLEKKVARSLQSVRDEIRIARTDLRGETREAIRALAERRIRLRLLGLTYVVVGLFLAWLGNVV